MHDRSRISSRTRATVAYRLWVSLMMAIRMRISFEELKAAMVKDIPVQRSGVPADVASAVSYFLREDASFISGQVLYVAGGPKA